ncbi:MAG: hypothetical protein AB2693_20440 [Candidatus Thiodiazotropha sp.]
MKIGNKNMEFGKKYENSKDADLDSEVGGVWQVQSRRKRHRRSTGGTFTSSYFKETVCSIDKEEFKKMSTDDKLVSIFEIVTSFGSLNTRVNSLEGHVHSLLALNVESDKRMKLVEYKSIDLEARNRRNNLIFRGHPEVLNQDDCEAIITSFLKNYLDIEGVTIQRAHRLGNLGVVGRRPGSYAPVRTQSRPIIVLFRDYKDVERILANAYKLRDANFGINRDYPPEIVNACSNLWADYKLEKSRHREGTVYIGFPAKLIVDRKIVRDKFPDWKEVLKGSRAATRKVDSQTISNSVRAQTQNVIKPSSGAIPKQTVNNVNVPASTPTPTFATVAAPAVSSSVVSQLEVQLQPPVGARSQVAKQDSFIDMAMMSDKSDSDTSDDSLLSEDRDQQALSSVNSDDITAATGTSDINYSQAIQQLQTTCDRAMGGATAAATPTTNQLNQSSTDQDQGQHK